MVAALPSILGLLPRLPRHALVHLQLLDGLLKAFEALGSTKAGESTTTGMSQGEGEWRGQFFLVVGSSPGAICLQMNDVSKNHITLQLGPPHATKGTVGVGSFIPSEFPPKIIQR